MTIEEIEQKYEDCCKNHPTNFEKRGEILWSWCRSLIEARRIDEAWLKSREAFYYSFLDNQSFAGFEVFSFRYFDEKGYALQDVKDGTMSFVHPAMFNDPFDTVLFTWLRNRIESKKGDTVASELAYMMLRRADALKARCFVRVTQLTPHDGTTAQKEQDIENVHPLMWAHYADSHKGFCLKYTFTDDFVTHDDAKHYFLSLQEVKYKTHIDLTKELTFKDALLTKADFWKYEHEVRAIVFAPEEKDMVYLSKKAPRINGIYLGLRCTTENRQKMIQTLRETNIPLYQMRFNPKDACRLVAERIG